MSKKVTDLINIRNQLKQEITATESVFMTIMHKLTNEYSSLEQEIHERISAGESVGDRVRDLCIQLNNWSPDSELERAIIETERKLKKYVGELVLVGHDCECDQYPDAPTKCYCIVQLIWGVLQSHELVFYQGGSVPSLAVEISREFGRKTAYPITDRGVGNQDIIGKYVAREFGNLVHVGNDAVLTHLQRRGISDEKIVLESYINGLNSCSGNFLEVVESVRETICHKLKEAKSQEYILNSVLACNARLIGFTDDEILELCQA